MTTMLCYITLAVILLAIIAFFLFRVRTGVLVLFAVGISIQYLERIIVGSFTALDLAGIGIPCLLVCGLLISRKNIIREFNKDKIIKNYCGLLILLLLSGVILTGLLYPSHSSLNFVERLGTWCKLLNGFVILLVVSSLFTDEKRINTMLNCMLLSLVIPGAIFIWQIASGNTVVSNRVGYHFADAFFNRPGVFAYYLLFCFPIALFKYSQSRRRKEMYFWILIILSFLVLLYLTYRRGVWLGLFAQLFAYFFLLQKAKHKLIYGCLFSVIAISLLFTQVSSTFEDRFSDISTYYDNISEAFETDRYNDLFSGRWGFFRANLLYLVKQPITNLIVGNGIGATHYASEEMGTSGGGHNIYLILLIDFGIISLLAYIFFHLTLFSKLLCSLTSTSPFVRGYSRSLISLIVSYLVMGMVTHVLYGNATNWLLWGLIGALIGLLTNKKYGR